MSSPADLKVATAAFSGTSASEGEGVQKKELSEYESTFQSDPRNLLARNALTQGRIGDVLLSRPKVLKHPGHFNVRVDPEGKATNQKASGRCWLFAATNVMRLRIMKEYNLEDAELSQPFLFFYDKVEKANWFLERVLDLRDSPLDGREMEFLCRDPVQDGGQWDMFVNLVEKYGVVPKAAYPESVQTSASAQVRWLLTCKLRQWAGELRDAHRQGTSLEELRTRKKAMIEETYRILAIACGEPPKSFDWTFRDKDKKTKEIRSLTPVEFYKEHTKYPATQTVSLIHDPRNPYQALYTVQYLGNVQGGRPVLYINLPVDQIKSLAVKALQGGKAVWFGCDVGKHFARSKGLMDMNVLDYDLGFQVQFSQDKADRLRYGESAMTHAMVFTGVHLEEGTERPLRWRVENSWGEDTGEKGYMVMSDEWFSEYTYQIVLEKEDLPSEVLDLLNQDPTVLPPWDPMGSLA
ncbi:peptidase C1B, bleomycin hydrolase [Piptocephalis cylindrospora]|uniref:Cysteine proteinase 1, mitochondrial n=1 Tax=Piptocephalis cylindrospora TaxID=1907219 RepID=A0A4P9Y6B5_9FUNG|nr:peptidase C1B, bleomycin hydrolase [Piptocephalis cylindrospora]|eukprot:RKP14535.1 peptidase C1B, bleomycin hydrolase [Piptocephalis cylindrospora]